MRAVLAPLLIEPIALCDLLRDVRALGHDVSAQALVLALENLGAVERGGVWVLPDWDAAREALTAELRESTAGAWDELDARIAVVPSDWNRIEATEEN